MEITIDFAAIGAWLLPKLYILAKIASGIFISMREFKYPIWDRDGVQVPRSLHRKVRAVIRNFAWNPEWAILKMVAFIPVWLFTGLKYWDRFSPWHLQSIPALCPKCKDKGKYDPHADAFMTPLPGAARSVECNCSVPTERTHDHTCVVCLDTGFIGCKRACPHCKRRELLHATLNNKHNKHFYRINRINGTSPLPFSFYCVGCGVFTTSDVNPSCHRRCQRCLDSAETYGSDIGSE